MTQCRGALVTPTNNEDMMAKAVQISKNNRDGGSVHGVGLGDLRVMIICESEGEWYAQGLDIDYLAQGANEAAAQKAFEKGLRATVGEHLKLHGNIKKLLKPAGPQVWEEFYQHASGSAFRYTQLSLHELDTPGEEHVIVAETKPPKPPKPKPLKQAQVRTLPYSGIKFYQASAQA